MDTEAALQLARMVKRRARKVMDDSAELRRLAAQLEEALDTPGGDTNGSPSEGARNGRAAQQSQLTR